MKPTFREFTEKALLKQREASEKARRAFEESEDPQIVIDYIKASASGAAITEPWIIEILPKWIRKDRHDLLKQALLPRRGENRESRKRAIENMMFAERIDGYRKQNLSLKKALIAEAERVRSGGIDLTGEEYLKMLSRLKSRYNRAKKIKPEITVRETARSFIVTAFPAKAEIQGRFIFGEWRYKFPKK